MKAHFLSFKTGHPCNHFLQFFIHCLEKIASKIQELMEPRFDEVLLAKFLTTANLDDMFPNAQTFTWRQTSPSVTGLYFIRPKQNKNLHNGANTALKQPGDAR